MDKPTMETLARRLDRVERENRRLKQPGVVALAVFTVLLVMGQALIATQVLAECAWIEWERFGMGKTFEEWEPHRSFESLTECNNHAEKWLRYYASQPKAVRNDTIVTWVAGEVVMGATIRCFPDTIDPRGKKE